MDFDSLRKAHPEFVYESFDYKISDKILKVKFHFHIAPDINFFPTLEVPIQDSVESIDNFVFNLGLVEMISYWKATCSPKITIKTGALDNEQVAWWKDLFINGLGEFFYQNKIDFRNILEIKTESNKKFEMPKGEKQGDLVLIGGGKDSAVTTEILGGRNALLLNPTPPALNVAEMAGFKTPIIVRRVIDPELLHLNEQGYLNGHTPFSAYLAFLSLLVAEIYRFKNIIVSNETSAGEANLEYMGLAVNHQYSKSYGFEKKFREYVNKYLTKEINYFSFLRPLNELQIAALFIQTEKYDKAFNSCNVGRGKYWCGACPKCAFVYLVFSSLVDKKRRERIFGEKDFFENEKIQGFIKDLTGRGIHKPLDCVGTEEESQMALKLIENPGNKVILAKIKSDWSAEHFLPKEYERLLKDKMANLNL